MPIVVVDSSFLINFLRIDRIDLLGIHPDSFIATDHVAAEISDPHQRRSYETALSVGHLTEIRVNDPIELETFSRLSQDGRLGAGERSVIAVTLNRNCRLAIDDKLAITCANTGVTISGSAIIVLRTQDFIVELIRYGALTVEEADTMLVDWATNHRFTIKIRSFSEVL